MYGDYIVYDFWLGKVYDLSNRIILKLSNGARYSHSSFLGALDRCSVCYSDTTERCVLFNDCIFLITVVFSTASLYVVCCVHTTVKLFF